MFLFLVSLDAKGDGAAGLLGAVGFDLGLDLGFFNVFGGLEWTVKGCNQMFLGMT